MISVKLILVLVYMVGISLQAIPSTYKAGVVEYYPSQSQTFDTKVQENLDAYKKFIEDAQKEAVDILVFPEGTLNGGIKNRSDAKEQTVEVEFPAKEVLCDQKQNAERKLPTIIEQLSCEAKKNTMYIVVNLSEREHCSDDLQNQHNDDRPCAPDGFHYYNTDVAFDRNGTVVARYRKYNLFSENHFNTTLHPEHSTFTTDFKVRFGLFTCFDIMFNEPALALVRQGVKDFVFPTMWFSELPFLTALQIQEYWAYSNDVNLLAAGASNTLLGSGGSGIYAGRMGPLKTYMSVPQNKDEEYKNNILITAEVPILVTHVPEKNNTENANRTRSLRSTIMYDVASQIPSNMDKFKLIRDKIDEYASELIGASFEKEVCNNDLCCTFNVTSDIKNKTESNKKYYQYRAVVGDVIRSFSGVTNGGIKTCGIVACSGDTIESCGIRFNDSDTVGSRQTFKSIHIEGKFPNIDEVFTMPNTLSHSMIPLQNHQFLYHEDKKDGEDKKTVTMDLRGLPEDELQTFAIYGRDFRFDGNGASTLSKTLAPTIIMIYLMKLILEN